MIVGGETSGSSPPVTSSQEPAEEEDSGIFTVELVTCTFQNHITLLKQHMVVVLTLVEFLQECSEDIKGYKEDDGAENVVEGKSDGQNEHYQGDSGTQISAAVNTVGGLEQEALQIFGKNSMLEDRMKKQNMVARDWMIMVGQGEVCSKGGGFSVKN